MSGGTGYFIVYADASLTGWTVLKLYCFIMTKLKLFTKPELPEMVGTGSQTWESSSPSSSLRLSAWPQEGV